MWSSVPVAMSTTVLDSSGVGTRAKLHILTAIDTYVTGSVLNELREVRAEQARAKAGLTDIDIAAPCRRGGTGSTDPACSYAFSTWRGCPGKCVTK
jgi:hypothetical protein